MEHLFSIVKNTRWADIFMQGERDFTVRLLKSGKFVREEKSDELDYCRQVAEEFVQEIVT